MSLVLIFLILTILLWKNKVKKPSLLDLTPYHLKIPEGFPEPIIPKDNQLTKARIDLGKKLFFDPILSRDSTISCGSCHHQELAFADKVKISQGVEGRLGFRNVPSLANVAYLGRLNKDGGVVKLDMQAVVPIEDKDEMDFSLLKAASRLNNHQVYIDMSLRAYGRLPHPFTIARALGAFCRTLISGYSNYDRYINNDEKEALTKSEIRGMNLFFSEITNCSECHSGFNFTNNSYHNNGVQDQYPIDIGRKRITLLAEDEGKYRVPSLRNIMLTAPYMHDGRIASLEAVVQHYNKGGSNHPNKSKIVRPLGMDESQQKDLVHFLQSLTDSSFIQNESFY